MSVKSEETTVKKKTVKKSKYEELPEIPDYEHPELEKYEESEFTPSPYVKQELNFGDREPKGLAKKSVEETPSKALKSEVKAEKPEEAAAKKVETIAPKKQDEPLEISHHKKPKLENNVESEVATQKVKEQAKEEADVDTRDSQKSVKKSVRKPIEKTETPGKAEERHQETPAETLAKRVALKKPKKHEPLPEIADYERPALEKYEESEFTPTPYVKQELSFGEREPESLVKKSLEEAPNQALKSEVQPEKLGETTFKKAETLPTKKPDELPEITDHEKLKLEKYEEIKFTPTPKAKESADQDAKDSQKSVKKPIRVPEEEKNKTGKTEEKAETPAEILAKRFRMKNPKKHEPLPKIADYERPALEKYEESEFTPTPYVKQELNFGNREPESSAQKAKVETPVKAEELPKIADAEKPDLEKYKKTEIEKTKKPEEIQTKTSGPNEKVDEPEKPVESPVEKAKPSESEKSPDSTKPSARKQKNPEEVETPVGSGKSPELEKKVVLELEKNKLPSNAKADLPEIPEYEKPKLEKYEKTEFEPTNKNLKLGKGKPTSADPEDKSTEVTINSPKTPFKSSTGESADASVTAKRQNLPPLIEESASKDIVITEPIEIKITDTDAPAKPRKRYDPMAYVPDCDNASEEPKNSDPPPDPEPKTYSRPKYDPMRWVPEKDDTEVNTIHTQNCTKFKVLNLEILSLIQSFKKNKAQNFQFFYFCFR